jgi:uncharacterized membrane protein
MHRGRLCRVQPVSLDVAVAQFDGEGTAVKRWSAAKDGPGGTADWIQKVGFVERHHSGRLLLRGTFAGHYLDVDEHDHVSERGAGEGVLAGGLVGVLLGPPGIAVGIALGGVVGSQVGKRADVEAEPDALAEQLRSAVPKSSSAVVLIAGAPDVDEMLAALSDGAQNVVRRELTAEEEADLKASLAAAPQASSEF